MKKNVIQQGQILPFACLLLTALIVIVFSYEQIWITGIEKIKHQQQSDSLVLQIANQQARALNVIAALNEVLSIASQRGYIVATALMTLRACTLLTFGMSPCTTALQRLETDAVPFFRKLTKLGKIVADQQDQVVQWALQTQDSLVQSYNLRHLGQKIAIPSKKYFLPIRRGQIPVVDKSLQTVFQYLGAFFTVPPPYSLTPDYFTQTNHIALALGHKKDLQLSSLFPLMIKQNILDPKDMWSMSEATIHGQDLSKMDFQAVLKKMDHAQPLWIVVTKQKIKLLALGFYPPKIQDFHEKIFH